MPGEAAGLGAAMEAGVPPQELAAAAVARRGPVEALAPGMFVILRSDESAAEIEKRFGRRLTPLFSNENHGVYRVR